MTTLQTFLGQADPNLVQMANEKADIYGIPREIFQALISTESSWNTSAQAKGSSAYGLTQLTAAAAKDVGADVQAVEDNLRGGAEYLSRQYAASNSWETALQRYYGGPSGYKTNPDAKAYSDKVLRLAGTAQPSTGGSTMTGANVSPTGGAQNTMYDNAGNPIQTGNVYGYDGRLIASDDPARADEVARNNTGESDGGIVGTIKEQMGNVSFIVLGIVVIAIALILTSKKTVISVAAEAVKDAVA